MNQTLTCHRKKIAILCLACRLLMLGLAGRLFFLMVFRSVHYSEMAEDLHQRERTLKAARGRILDRNGTVIADNRAVCTISVIRSQITDPEAVILLLTEELELDETEVRKKVEKRSSREIIRTNVDKETGDRIRGQRLAGVKVDEDYKRYYPYGSLASRVLGFTGADNQGIIGLEVQYESWLKGTPGRILTMTDAAGVELDGMPEDRVEPEAGADLVIDSIRELPSAIDELNRRLAETAGRVEEALEFFAHVPSIRRKMETLNDVGLSYIRLGQPSTELSGGEAQRIKLASELSKRSTGKTVYILDEPTTGLHFADVHKLTEILRRLSGDGNTVIVIEHNLDVIKTADYIIDIGPEGGDRGGTVVACGTPEEVSRNEKSYTGKYIDAMLKK